MATCLRPLIRAKVHALNVSYPRTPGKKLPKGLGFIGPIGLRLRVQGS